MSKENNPTRVVVMTATLFAAQAIGLCHCLAETWAWNRPHAEVSPRGDLQWRPEPFAFQPGDEIRYIDYDLGDDNAAGSREAPWQHHPWDPAASGKAAFASGPITYVFKGGVIYRGKLIADESGTAEQPIRLTRDPDWGHGPATLAGSERIVGWRRGASHPDIPDADNVYWKDLDFAPRNVWMIDRQGRTSRIPLARTPNWRVSDPDDIKSEWFEFNNPASKDLWGAKVSVNGVVRPLGYDTIHLTREPEFYENALIWSEYGWVMGTPYPSRVVKFDPEKSSLAFGGQWGGHIGKYHYPRHVRYYLEDKPHYLDDTQLGEFWFDKRGRGGRLFLRLPGDADPNDVAIEAGHRLGIIDSRGMSHIHITGLSFRFTNVLFDLTLPPGNPDVDPACVRLLGSGSDIVVAHCDFRHVHLPIRIDASGNKNVIDRIAICDNTMSYTDHGGISIADESSWGEEYPLGRLLDVKVLRNRLHEIGHRPNRYGQGHAIDIRCAETLEVAGNVLDRLYGAGIFVYGGKTSSAKTDRPLTRILIHHNKVTDPLLNNNDWGGIETWQGGPAFVFNNVSGNPGGFKHWGNKNPNAGPASSRFGHAYYMDGAFKQYYFNNIAWGRSNDPFDRLGNTSAFQEIHGYACSIFNNTVYNFVIGSRRQAPTAGRNKYLGNVWQDIGFLVFRHADPKDIAADPNAADAGAQPSSYRHETNAYADNVFYGLPDRFAVFEPSGRWHADLPSFRKALKMRGSIGDVGVLVKQPPLRNPAAHDFRPTHAARDHGVKVFVPWALYAPVAEWNFCPAGNDPTIIPDDHFYLSANYVGRESYHRQPTYPLQAVNMTADCYVDGPLEDWVKGALRFNGVDQYALLPHAKLTSDVTDADSKATPKQCPSPSVDRSNFLIEAYFRTRPGDVGGTIIEKMDTAGYALRVTDQGTIIFSLAAKNQLYELRSNTFVNDGDWHHVIAEADRSNRTVRIYVDGKLDKQASGLGSVSIANEADLYVGGLPHGGYLAGEIDFMRISLGTLADAKTTIEELSAWQFDGPFLRDFVGRPTTGRRDAGAIELTSPK